METRLKTNRTRRGFTFIEIMIVAGLIGMLTIIALPNFLRYRVASRRGVCIANLKQMQNAKVQWACEHRKALTDVPAESDLIGASNYLRDKPVCPSGGNDYITTIGQVDQYATCTISLVEGHTL